MAKTSKSKPSPPEPAPQVDPLEVEIKIPTKDVQALLNMVDGGNRTAIVDVANQIREMAEKQNPAIFLR